MSQKNLNSIKNEPIKILITGVGGPTPRSFAISLKKYGIKSNYTIFGTDINPLAIGLYRKDLFYKTQVIPAASDPGYWEAIETIIIKEKIDLAVILPELEVLEWARKQKEGDLPCKALIPDLDLAQALFDKTQMTEMLAPLGLVPESIGFSREKGGLENVSHKLKYPFWVRSSSGTSGLGSLKVENQQALENWVSINPEVNHFLASAYLPGRNLACKLLYFDGVLVRSACAERVQYIMSKVAPSGITGNTSFGRLINEPDLVAIAEKALDHLFQRTKSKKHGFFTLDFKENEDGKPLITEINIRHVAFTQCFAAGGANFADDTVRLLAGDTSFDTAYNMYEFEEGLIFLRDVDAHPVLMKEKDLLK